MQPLTLMYRYLKARERINENAGLLADLIKNEEGVDAVLLHTDQTAMAKPLLDQTRLSYCLASVNGKPILMYPTEERQKYLAVMPLLQYNGPVAEYGGFSYSETKTMIELLNSRGIQYHTMYAMDGRTTFLFPQAREKEVKQAVRALKDELETEVGKKNYIRQNICWNYAVSQISTALAYNGVSFFGSEGGAMGIRIDETGAILFAQNKPGRYIRRADANFQTTVIQMVLSDLHGAVAPIKVFYGDFADELTKNLQKGKNSEKSMSKREALQLLGLPDIPKTTAEWDELVDHAEEYEGKQEEAYYTVLRMAACRQQTLKGLENCKLTKEEKQEFQKIHATMIEQFSGNAEEKAYER